MITNSRNVEMLINIVFAHLSISVRLWYPLLDIRHMPAHSDRSLIVDGQHREQLSMR